MGVVRAVQVRGGFPGLQTPKVRQKDNRVFKFGHCGPSRDRLCQRGGLSGHCGRRRAGRVAEIKGQRKEHVT